MIRILWFTGVQLPAVTGEDLNRAGWQEGLRRTLESHSDRVELAIASFGSEDYQPFTEGNATYYNIHRDPIPDDRWSRLVKNWKHVSYQEKELSRCQEIVELVQPDLIFIFGTENPFGLLSNRFPVPVVISIQAVLNGLEKRIFHGLTSIELIKEFFSKEMIMGEGVIHRRWELAKSARMEKTIYNRCRIFEGRTDWDKEWLRKLNPKAKYFHIDRVLAEDYYNSKWDQEKTEEKLVYTTSSNAPFKGGITLVRALVELKNRGRLDIKMRIAGVDATSVVGKYINTIVNRNKLQDQISLLGRVQPDEIIQEMKKASVFVLPSHMDNSPNSLGEAMIIGMPCIASNVGGIPSMLEDKKDGLIYNHNSTKQLADHIEYMLDHPDQAVEMGINARNTALKRHDPTRIAEDTVAMYNQVIKGKMPVREAQKERRASMVEKISERIKLGIYIARHGVLPEHEDVITPYLSQQELAEIKTVFPMPKFFIYGHARSGTTLLARLIRIHPDIHCNYQAHFFSREPTLHALVESPQVREWLSRPDNRWNQGKDLSPVVLRVVADYIMEREAKQLGKKIVGDKSPNSLLDGKSVTKLYSVYPDASLFYIVRDGRDTVLSHRIQAFIDFQDLLSKEDKIIREDFIQHPEPFINGEKSLFTRQGLEKVAHGWVKNMVETDTLAKQRFGNRYYSLRYEDLLVDPQKVMDGIWKFFDVDLDFDKEEKAVYAEMNNNPDADWQRSQEKDLIANYKKGKIGGWKNLFTAEDNQIFSEIARDVLETWGYE